MLRQRLTACLLLLLGAAVPGRALVPTVTGMRATVAHQSSDAARSGDLLQFATALRGSFRWGSTVTMEAEAATQHASVGGASLSLDQSLSGAILLSYRSAGAPWVLRLGCATPSTTGDLSAEERALVRRVGEPLLGFADRDPLRGWRLQTSGAFGWPVRRWLSVSLGIGTELAAGFDVAGDARLDPADRVATILGVAGESHGATWRGCVSLAREGKERVGGQTVRGARSVFGAELEGRRQWGWVQLDARAEQVSAGRAALADADVYGDLVTAGPGRETGIHLSASPVGVPLRWGDWRARPSLACGYRRHLPQGLPGSDGWVFEMGPAIVFESGGREVHGSLAWTAGRWTPYDGDGGRERLAGWRMSWSYLWLRDPPVSGDGP